jgi:hypothetical protein
MTIFIGADKKGAQLVDNELRLFSHGKSEATNESKHPSHFTSTGSRTSSTLE